MPKLQKKPPFQIFFDWGSCFSLHKLKQRRLWCLFSKRCILHKLNRFSMVVFLLPLIYYFHMHYITQFLAINFNWWPKYSVIRWNEVAYCVALFFWARLQRTKISGLSGLMCASSANSIPALCPSKRPFQYHKTNNCFAFHARFARFLAPSLTRVFWTFFLLSRSVEVVRGRYSPSSCSKFGDLPVILCNKNVVSWQPRHDRHMTALSQVPAVS